MKVGLSVLLALLPVALALPSPMPQNDAYKPSANGTLGEIDLSDLADLPDPTPVPVDVVSSTINMYTVATSLAAVQSITAQTAVPTASQLSRRQTGSCAQFSTFATANTAITNTVSAFQSYFNDATPSLDGYTSVAPANPNYSIGPKNGLLSVNAYSTYDPSVCKAKCDSMANCQSFGIWRERVPQQKYNANTCPSPSLDAAYQTKCLYYSYDLAASDANNQGQWTNNGKFNVAQASVKFFNKLPWSPAAVPGFSGPAGGQGVCAPAGTTADADKVITAAGTFSADSLARTPGPMNTAIDPSFCAKQCQSITSSSAADPTSGIKLNCNMFSLFIIRNNNKDYWQCQYWTKDLDDSRNTNCGGGAVVASWKYVLSPPGSPYVNTKPPTTPAQCTGSDSSTYGVRCIEDFQNANGRADTVLNYVYSGDQGGASYALNVNKLVGFFDRNGQSSGNEYYIHDPNFNQADATTLSGDKIFGLAFQQGDNTYTISASGFVFDLESIDLASWFLFDVNNGDTLTIYGMRDGAVVTQASPAVQVPSQAGQPFSHFSGLSDLGFKKIDAIKIVSTSYYNWVAFDNVVLTRYAADTPRTRRDLSANFLPVVAAPGIQRRDNTSDLVFSGKVSLIAKEMFVPANSTSAANATSTQN